MSNIYLGLQLLHYVQTMVFAKHSVLNNNRNVGMASPCSWPLTEHLVSNDNGNVETASPCGWPNNFSCHLPVFAVDLADNDDSPAFAASFSDDGKLGYGFTSADDLKRLTSVPGISRDRHLSAKSWIQSCVRR